MLMLRECLDLNQSFYFHSLLLLIRLKFKYSLNKFLINLSAYHAIILSCWCRTLLHQLHRRLMLIRYRGVHPSHSYRRYDILLTGFASEPGVYRPHRHISPGRAASSSAYHRPTRHRHPLMDSAPGAILFHYSGSSRHSPIVASNELSIVNTSPSPSVIARKLSTSSPAGKHLT